MNRSGRPRIAVVMPAYNAARHIEDALTSVLRQTLPADEIIVADDASSDGTADRAQSVDPSIRVLRLERNRGCSAARNAALAVTTADRIALLDADDIWLPDHLANLSAALDRFPTAVLAFCRAQQFGDDAFLQEARIPIGEPHDAFWACTRNDVVYPQTSMTRRIALDAAGRFRVDLRYCEDTEFFRRVSAVGPFVCVPEITVRYRRHAEQATAAPRQLLSLEAEYAIRREWYEAALAGGDEAIVLRHAVIFREFLDRHLRRAWDQRNWRHLRRNFAFGRWIPGATWVLLRWLPRLALFPTLPLLDRLRGISAPPA
jgi:glycosyltransferase involved in cell wall biosynthesis